MILELRGVWTHRGTLSHLLGGVHTYMVSKSCPRYVYLGVGPSDLFLSKHS